MAEGTLAALSLRVADGVRPVTVSGAFRDPDGDVLTYGALSSATAVATVSVSGSRVEVTPVSGGTATVTVTATDVEGSNTSATQTIASPIGRTWIWSDLHLGDRGPLEAFDRPFADVPAMNRHLLARWRQRVQPGDTIICLGDVAHPDAWRDRRLVLDLPACPGERILILGNHDTDLRALAEAGFATQHRQALYEAEPTLALSHEPLAAVPVGAVNVHGHLHDGTEPTHRHVNVAVERWNYEPVPMATVAARALGRWK